jgi:hypothetical protein
MSSNISIAKPVGTVAYQGALPHLGWAAQVAAAWAVAGGAAGGSLVAALLLAGRLHASDSVLIAMLLASAGSALGLVHGAVVGYLGRHAGPDAELHKPSRLFGVACAVTGVVASIALSGWLALSAVLVRAGSLWGWPALLAGGATVLVAAAWATVLGWRSLDCAYHEWPRHTLGAALVGGSFLVICATLLLLRPALPGTRLQFSVAGFIMVSALATIWIAMPAIILALRWAPRDRAASSPAD